MAVWRPTDGYFTTLLDALLGRALRRVDGVQVRGGTSAVGAGKSVTADTALQLSAVWACARLIAEAVGAMPILVKRVNRDGSRTIVSDHWLGEILNKSPNRYQTRNEFFETLVLSLMLSGNAYALKANGTGGRLVQLTPFMPAQMEVSHVDGGERVYKYSNGADVAVFSQDRVWHMMLMPSNGIVGLSPLQYGARSMGIAMAAEDRVATLAANGFKPTGVLMIDRLLKPEQREAIRSEFADLQEGKGDPLKVLEAGMKYQQITMSPKDVQLLESRRFSLEDVCRFFGVPSVLVNDTSATTVWGTGISEIKEGFYTLALRPLLERIESSIAKWLIPASERANIVVEFDFSAFLRGNEATRITMYTAAITGKLMTIDEARARFDDLPAVPGGKGAVMYDQGQMVPLGTEARNDGTPQTA